MSLKNAILLSAALALGAVTQALAQTPTSSGRSGTSGKHGGGRDGGSMSHDGGM